MPNSVNDPSHWFERAASMRALAGSMKDVKARAMMLRLADDYDKLADRAEQRADGKRARQPEER